jgi:hypothetical protein
MRYLWYRFEIGFGERRRWKWAELKARERRSAPVRFLVDDGEKAE